MKKTRKLAEMEATGRDEKFKYYQYSQNIVQPQEKVDKRRKHLRHKNILLEIEN